MQLKTIKEINCLNPNELKEFYNSLNIEAKKKVSRILMPSKLTDIFYKKRYKFLYSGRGPGKSMSVAKALLYLGDIKRLKTLCGREIQNSIKDSVHSSLKDLIYELEYDSYKVTDAEITNKITGTEFIFKGLKDEGKKQSIKSFSNIDIVWIEEAQSVSEETLRVLDPTIRKKGSELWFTFNRLLPDDPVWLFQQRIPDEEKLLIYMTYLDNPYLPDTLLKLALRSKKEYEDKINENYPHIWLGEPAQFSDKTIIKYQEVLNAINRNISNEGEIVIGADIARFGKNRTVFFKRKGLKIIDWRMYPKLSIPENVRYLTEFVGINNTNIPIRIDDTGVGGGVTDYMRKDGYNVIPVNFGQKAQAPEKYFNAISEMWFYFKDIINEISIPDIQELKNELVTREYGFDNKGRRKVQSKDEYKKKYGKSPDYADAILLCYYNIIGASAYFIDGVI